MMTTNDNDHHLGGNTLLIYCNMWDMGIIQYCTMKLHHLSQGNIKMKKTINRHVKSSDTFQAPIIVHVAHIDSNTDTGTSTSTWHVMACVTN